MALSLELGVVSGTLDRVHRLHEAGRFAASHLADGRFAIRAV